MSMTDITPSDSFARIIASGNVARSGLEGTLRVRHRRVRVDRAEPAHATAGYVELNGRLTLYAKRDATDQLRRKHAVSIEIVDRTVQEEIYVVRARAMTPDGRTDESLGAVSLAGLEGRIWRMP